MEWVNRDNVLIVGLGLMGGSYARALQRLGYHVMAIDKDPDAIAFALENGVIDEGAVTVEEALVQKADTAIFALYPNVFKRWIADNQHLFKPGIFITDVTGVKSCVVYDIQNMLRPDVEFIAAHPMAGKESSGVQNSDERIFHNANYVVVPTSANSPQAIEWCKNLGQVLGFARISVLSPEEHDQVIGFVSQLMHAIAVVLMECSDNRHLADYTGDSFRDLTRIARINDAMWSELFLLNKEALLAQMDAFSREFDAFRQLIENEDVEAIRQSMRRSTERRAWFDKKE
ncbi:MAG TPA: prephenate dehydrogenase/arogenate dehydrogenase family protein [Eggerthellaceae bacterium]|nr:prephenate dehydrogenase/arogenate dehydrogenase family protein [Eggerthellaceae bacterium]